MLEATDARWPGQYVQCVGRRRIVVQRDDTDPTRAADILLHIYLGEHKRLATLRLSRLDAESLLDKLVAGLNA